MKLNSYSNTFWVEVALSVIAGSIVGAFLIYSFAKLDTKWSYFFIGATGAISCLMAYKAISSGLHNLLILAAIYTLPIPYDINFFYRDNIPFLAAANGITVSMFDILFLPVFIQWFISTFLKKEGRFDLDKSWFYPLLGLMIFNGISCLFSPLPFFSWSMFLWIFKAYIIFYYFLNAIRSDEFLRRISHVFALMLFTQAVIVFEQKFVGSIFTEEFMGRRISIVSLVGLEKMTRVGGTLTHPNELAMFINLFLPAVIFFTLSEPKKLWKLFFIVTIVLAVIVEVWTASRGGWTGLVFSMVISTYLLLMKRGYNLVKVTMITAFIGAFAFTTLFATSSTFRNRLTGEDYGTAELRYPLMAVAKNMISQKPLTGVGLNIYTAEMQQYDNTPEYVSKEYPHPVHNTYLLTAAESGVPTLVAFMALLSIVLYRAFRVMWKAKGNAEFMAVGILGAFISWSMHNIVNMDHIFMNYSIWVLMGLLAAIEHMVKDYDKEDRLEIKPTSSAESKFSVRA
jgi:putative inorganic carbon (hco3(-)) transporter